MLDARVYFTHFVQFGMKPEHVDILAAVLRGHAIQCEHQQEEVDMVIPAVLRPKES